MSEVLTSYEKKLNQQEMPAGKKKVLLAALHLFANHGFHATTTAEIAHQAGVSEGTIYKYFGSKKELLTALLIPILTTVRDSFFGEIKHYDHLSDLVKFIIDNRISFVRDNFDLIKIVMQELLTEKDELSPAFKEAFGGSRGIFTSIKRLQTEYPEINPALTPIQIIRCMVGPALALICQEKIIGIKYSPADIQLVYRQAIAGLTNQ